MRRCGRRPTRREITPAGAGRTGKTGPDGPIAAQHTNHIVFKSRFNRKPYYNRVLRLAFPVILSQAGQMLVQLVDNAMVDLF